MSIWVRIRGMRGGSKATGVVGAGIPSALVNSPRAALRVIAGANIDRRLDLRDPLVAVNADKSAVNCLVEVPLIVECGFLDKGHDRQKQGIFGPDNDHSPSSSWYFLPVIAPGG